MTEKVFSYGDFIRQVLSVGRISFTIEEVMRQENRTGILIPFGKKWRDCTYQTRLLRHYHSGVFPAKKRPASYVYQ